MGHANSQSPLLGRMIILNLKSFEESKSRVVSLSDDSTKPKSFWKTDIDRLDRHAATRCIIGGGSRGVR